MKLTVGIATWNRAELLAQTLEGLTKLRVPQDVQWEVLVCDNNSTDHTRSIVEKEIASGRLPLRYLHEPRQGQGNAHNHIVAEMTGDWLMILDDDVLVDPDWMVVYVQAIGRYPAAGCLAGQVLPWTQWEPRGSRAYLLEQFPWVQAVLRFETDIPVTRGCGKYPHGPNMAFRADVLREKSFDPHKGMKGKQRGLGEDTDYALSVVDRGYQAWLVAANKVRHYIPSRAGRVALVLSLALCFRAIVFIGKGASSGRWRRLATLALQTHHPSAFVVAVAPIRWPKKTSLRNPGRSLHPVGLSAGQQATGSVTFHFHSDLPAAFSSNLSKVPPGSGSICAKALSRPRKPIDCH
ncbi:MAG: glycosyltransferase family 2 protein [Phycisphaerales bacterium]|nr:glycosyltransferase family 2 protein [Phycisphaerales bacterium]